MNKKSNLFGLLLIVFFFILLFQFLGIASIHYPATNTDFYDYYRDENTYCVQSKESYSCENPDYDGYTWCEVYLPVTYSDCFLVYTYRDIEEDDQGNLIYGTQIKTYSTGNYDSSNGCMILATKKRILSFEGCFVKDSRDPRQVYLDNQPDRPDQNDDYQDPDNNDDPLENPIPSNFLKELFDAIMNFIKKLLGG